MEHIFVTLHWYFWANTSLLTGMLRL